jgi:hypothetical protein
MKGIFLDEIKLLKDEHQIPGDRNPEGQRGRLPGGGKSGRLHRDDLGRRKTENGNSNRSIYPLFTPRAG